MSKMWWFGFSVLGSGEIVFNLYSDLPSFRLYIQKYADNTYLRMCYVILYLEGLCLKLILTG